MIYEGGRGRCGGRGMGCIKGKIKSGIKLGEKRDGILMREMRSRVEFGLKRRARVSANDAKKMAGMGCGI